MKRILIAFALVVAAPIHAASVDGIAIHSSSVGTGPTIVFVHGWTCDMSSWAEQVPVFAKDYRVVTLDLPGHGRSGSPTGGGFSMDLFARAVEAVRAEASADEIVLVGHSMGVVVVKQYAMKYPNRVAGLVAVDGPLDMRAFAERTGGPPPAMTREARENMIRGMFVSTTPVALQQQILATMLGTPEATAIGAGAAMFDPSIRTADVIKAPTLAIVAGTAQVPSSESLKEIVPNFEATQIAGTGHFLMLEKPAEFNRLLAAFLERIQY